MDKDVQPPQHFRMSQYEKMIASQKAQADPFLPDPYLEKANSRKDQSTASNTAFGRTGKSWFTWGAKASDVCEDSVQVPHLDVKALKSKDGKQTKQSAQADRVYRERVLIRVYHLNKASATRAFNRNLKQYGLYHTGVELYGREWSFGMTFDDWSTGITWNPPMDNPDHTYHETLSMGYTALSPTQVWQLIEEMKVQWRGCEYHVLSRNCHSFTDAFCMRLGVNRAPTWINELAGVGEGIIDFLDGDEERGDPITDWFKQLRKTLDNAFSPAANLDSIVETKPRCRSSWSAYPREDGPTRHNPFAALAV